MWPTLLLAFLFQSAVPVIFPEGVVNAASNRPGPLAPNTLVSVYGRNLSLYTRALDAHDFPTTLPSTIPGTAVRVTLGGIAAFPLYISPTQINVLIPSRILPGPTDLVVHTEGRMAEPVPVVLEATSPALFQSGPYVIASKLNGSLATPDSPLAPGNVAILYATGLGQLQEIQAEGTLPKTAIRIRDFASFRVEFDGTPIAPEDLIYVGVAPGFAGVYQINLVVPSWVKPNPEIRVGFAGRLSPPGPFLPVQSPSEPH
jgi:uncharacterized protein (TIGR03437 family)